MPVLDLVIVSAFVLHAVASGFRSRNKASGNLREYFLAGRTLKGWHAGFSMAATQYAADTPLLVTGLVATGGIFEIWRLWIYGVAFLMMAFVFSSGWRRAGVLTDAELTEIRYSGKGVLTLRILKALYYGTVINCVVLAMVLVAATRIAEIFLPWNQWIPAGLYLPLLHVTRGLGISLAGGATDLSSAVATTNNLISILSILGFTALYSMTGGLRSVVATDIVQFSLAMLGTLVYAILVASHAGGLENIAAKIVDLYGTDLAAGILSFAPLEGGKILPFVILLSLQWFFQMNSDGTGYLAQRSMACATDRDARIAGLVFTWAQILLRSLIWLVIGLGLLVLYPFSPEDMAGEHFAASREILFVQGIEDFLPAGIRGLMLTGLLAALASTVDTHLNWGASYWSNDLYKRWICRAWLHKEPGSRELVRVARLSNLAILVLALCIMANLGSIQEAWFISLLFGAGMGSVLALRWLWERINLYSELAAMGASLVCAPVLLITADSEWVRLSVMALVSTAAAVGAAVVTPPTDGKVLKEFYQKVRPMGYWGKTALAEGEDPREPVTRLWKELTTTCLTALSLFFLLAGIGKWLISAPSQSEIRTGFYIIAGLALIPFWWRNALGTKISGA